MMSQVVKYHDLHQKPPLLREERIKKETTEKKTSSMHRRSKELDQPSFLLSSLALFIWHQFFKLRGVSQQRNMMACSRRGWVQSLNGRICKELNGFSSSSLLDACRNFPRRCRGSFSAMVFLCGKASCFPSLW